MNSANKTYPYGKIRLLANICSNIAANIHFSYANQFSCKQLLQHCRNKLRQMFARKSVAVIVAAILRQIHQLQCCSNIAGKLISCNIAATLQQIFQQFQLKNQELKTKHLKKYDLIIKQIFLCPLQVVVLHLCIFQFRFSVLTVLKVEFSDFKYKRCYPNYV